MSRPVARRESVRIANIIRERADREPERVCLTFYGPRDEPDQVTYGSLHREASAFSTVFRNHGLAPGSPVVLFAYSTRQFVSAFLGMQRAGLLAIPVPRPDPLEHGRRSEERVVALRGNQVCVILTDAPAQTRVRLPFFLKHVDIAVGPFELARSTGAPLLPFFIVAPEGPQRFRLELLPPVGGSPGPGREGLAETARDFLSPYAAYAERYPSHLPSHFIASP